MAVYLIKENKSLDLNEINKEINKIAQLLNGIPEYDEDSDRGRIRPKSDRYFSELFEWKDFNEFFNNLGYKTCKVSWHFFAEKFIDSRKVEFESKDGRCSFVIYNESLKEDIDLKNNFDKIKKLIMSCDLSSLVSVKESEDEIILNLSPVKDKIKDLLISYGMKFFGRFGGGHVLEGDAYSIDGCDEVVVVCSDENDIAIFVVSKDHDALHPTN